MPNPNMSPAMASGGGETDPSMMGAGGGSGVCPTCGTPDIVAQALQQSAGMAGGNVPSDPSAPPSPEPDGDEADQQSMDDATALEGKQGKPFRDKKGVASLMQSMRGVK